MKSELTILVISLNDFARRENFIYFFFYRKRQIHHESHFTNWVYEFDSEKVIVDF